MIRVLTGKTIKVENALIVKISKAPLNVTEEVNTPINITMQSEKYGIIFSSVRKSWAKIVKIGDKISGTMVVQKRGFEGSPILVAKKIVKVKIEFGSENG